MALANIFSGETAQQAMQDLLSNVNFNPQRNVGSGSGYMTNSQTPTQTTEQTAQQEKKDEASGSVGVGVGGGSGSGGTVSRDSTDTSSIGGGINLGKYMPYAAIALGVIFLIAVIFKIKGKKGKKK
jgi:hypothetical protein